MPSVVYCEEKLVSRTQHMPRISKRITSIIVQWLPWITLVLGIIMMPLTWVLWTWLSVPNRLAVGGDALLYLAAFPGLQARKKWGWNMLFYGTLIQLFYGGWDMLAGASSLGAFIGRTFGVVMISYLLLHLRSYYLPTDTPLR